MFLLLGITPRLLFFWSSGLLVDAVEGTMLGLVSNNIKHATADKSVIIPQLNMSLPLTVLVHVKKFIETESESHRSLFLTDTGVFLTCYSSSFSPVLATLHSPPPAEFEHLQSVTHMSTDLQDVWGLKSNTTLPSKPASKL